MSECTFEGFEQANTTPVPDILFDQLLTELSGAEIKVVLYIIRRTAGFKKNADAISFNQFLNGITTREGKVLDKGCGIKDRTTLSKTLASLEKKKCITASKGNDPHGDKATTTYSIFFKEVVGKSYHPVSRGSREIIPPVVGNPYYGSREIIPGVVGKSYLQETVIQETVIQENTYVNADALTRTHSQETPSDNENYYQQDIPSVDNSQQPSTDIPIATTKGDTTHGRNTDTLSLPVLNPDSQDSQHHAPAQGQAALIGVATRNTESLPEIPPAPDKPTTNKKNRPVPTGPLEMPSDDARWCAEIAVQIVEFKKGRRYGEVTRKQELEKARQVLKYEINGALLTRAQFIHAWDKMVEWPLWVEKNIAPMIKHLLKDDRIISLLPRQTRSVSGVATNGSQINGQKPRASALVSEEQAKKNKERLFANAAAKGYKPTSKVVGE